MVIEHKFTSQEAWLRALVKRCYQTLNMAINEQGTHPLVYLSGGGTPKPLYERLAATDLDYSAVDWAMVDERWVAPSHTRSNQQFIENCFIGATGFHLAPLKNSEMTPELGMDEVECRYQAFAARSTLCILGMGGDGHMASLFPEAAGLVQALDRSRHQKVAAINAIPSVITGEETARMSLTLNTLLNSQNLLLLLTGEEKYRCFQHALEQNDYCKMPISALLNQQQTDVHLYWCP